MTSERVTVPPDHEQVVQQLTDSTPIISPPSSRNRKVPQWRTAIPPDLIARFRQLYVHEPRRYGLQMSDGSCPAVKGVVSDRQIALHLMGRQCLVLYPSFTRRRDGKAFTRWGSWDVDWIVEPPNDKVFEDWTSHVLSQIRAAAVALGVDGTRVHCYRTGKKGIRPEVHFDEPVSVELWVRFFRLVLEYGPEGERLCDLAYARFECRPDVAGNPVRPPLGVHAQTGKWACYVDPATGKPVADGWDYLMAIQHVSAAAVRNTVLAAKRNRGSEKRAGRGPASIEEASRQRQRLDSVLSGLLPGPDSRHRYYPLLVARLKELGHGADEVYGLMVRWTERQQEAGLINSLRSRWEKDLLSTIERVFDGKFRLKASRRVPEITDAEARALLAGVIDHFPRLVLVHLIRFGRSLTTGPDDSFFAGTKQIAEAIYGHNRLLTEQEIADRANHISRALAKLIRLGMVERPPELQPTAPDHAAVYRIPSVPNPGFSLRLCEQPSTCRNCDYVVLGQLLTRQDMSEHLSRRTTERVLREGNSAPCLAGHHV